MTNSEEQELTKSFFDSVKANHLNQVIALLDKGVNANVIEKSNDFWSALMYAAEIGNNAMVEVLLAHGADPAIKAQSGNFALSIAMKNDYDQVTKTLLRVAPEEHIYEVYDLLREDEITFLKELGRSKA
jgi:ankyrin repeat protein